MKAIKRRKLEAAGWKFGNAAEFLRLTPKEAADVEYALKRLRIAHRSGDESKPRSHNTGANQLSLQAPTLENCINTRCPWSGKPVQGDALTEYKGRIVGFCNTGCRDKFERAVSKFEELLAEDVTAPTD